MVQRRFTFQEGGLGGYFRIADHPDGTWRVPAAHVGAAANPGAGTVGL